MGGIVRMLILRLVQLIGRILAISGLLLLAVLVGIFGGLWTQSSPLAQATLATTGLSILSGHMQDGPFYWIARTVLFALMLAFWVISCFVVVWLTRMAFGFNG
jgi:hypothetical protein